MYKIEIDKDKDLVTIKPTCSFYRYCSVSLSTTDWQKMIENSKPHSGYSAEEIAATHAWLTL